MPSDAKIVSVVFIFMLLIAGVWYYYSGQYRANSIPRLENTEYTQ